jgi:hypothetical protein
METSQKDPEARLKGPPTGQIRENLEIKTKNDSNVYSPLNNLRIHEYFNKYCSYMVSNG